MEVTPRRRMVSCSCIPGVSLHCQTCARDLFPCKALLAASAPGTCSIVFYPASQGKVSSPEAVPFSATPAHQFHWSWLKSGLSTTSTVFRFWQKPGRQLCIPKKSALGSSCRSKCIVALSTSDIAAKPPPPNLSPTTPISTSCLRRKWPRFLSWQKLPTEMNNREEETTIFKHERGTWKQRYWVHTFASSNEVPNLVILA